MSNDFGTEDRDKMDRLILKLFPGHAKGQLPIAIQQISNKFGLKFVPLHQGVNDPTLESYFYSDLTENRTYGKLLDELNRCDSVDGVYIKSEGEPPIETL